MALIHRVSRLLTADIHAVLDRLEEPEALLRQAIREMEEALARTETRVAALERERATVVRRARQVEEALSALDAELGAALDAGNDALARRLVRRKLEGSRLGKHLSIRLETLGASLDAERAALAEQREQLELTRQKAELFGDERLAPSGEQRFDRELGVSEDEVEAALARERQRRRPS